MPRLPATLRTLVLLIAIPALFGAKGRCRRAPPVDPDADRVAEGDRPDVAAAVQVVSVSPGAVQPGMPTPITVYGAGFQPGATVTVGGLAGTGIHVADPNTLTLSAPGLPEGTHDLRVANPDGTAATLRQGLRAVASGVSDASCARMAMYFDLDSASLAPAALQALDAALPCLRTRAVIALEGHADERGTTDYNVALGQRRAEAVQRYLLGQGIPLGSLPVVSYGEERPADPASNEAAWAKNRRVDMVSR